MPIFVYQFFMKRSFFALLCCSFVLSAGAQHLADTFIHKRKALIENFTGAKCGNCPVALAQMDSIAAQHPDSVSLLNIHSGFYASTNTQYTLDLRTAWGTAEDNYFGMANAGTPDGLVNREVAGSSPILYHANYSAMVNAVITGNNSPVNIGASATYNNQVLTVNTELYFRSALPGAFLNVVLAEDSIWGYQLDYTQPTGSQYTYIKHNHVLRSSFTNQWDGTLLSSSITAMGNYYPQTYTYTVPSGVNISNCYVITYVSDTTSGRVVYTTQSTKVAGANAVHSIMNNDVLRVCPNPGNGQFMLEVPFEEESVKVELVNQVGEFVAGKEVPRQNKYVDFSYLTDGLYFLKVVTGKRNYQAKLLLLH